MKSPEMYFSKCGVLAVILFGQLIATVNRDKEEIQVGYEDGESTKQWKVLSREASKALSVVLASSRWLEDDSDSALVAIPSVSIGNRRSKRSLETNVWKVPASPLCSPWDSCIGRCGHSPRGLPFICNCDALCFFYADCCVDFTLQCDSSDLDATASIPLLTDVFSRAPPKCEKRPPFKWPTYVISNCSTSWSNDSVAEKCRDSYLHPVASDSGFLYASSDCAACNGETAFTDVDPDVLAAGMHVSDRHIWPKNISEEVGDLRNSLRMCFPAVDTCSLSDIYIQNQSLAALCAGHGGPLVKHSRDNTQETELLFKNIYCALCNGVDPHTLTCPKWVLSPNPGMSSQIMFHSVTANVVSDNEKMIDVQGLSVDDIPASFSILLNFGLDGRERMMFSSEGEEEMKRYQALCGQDHIWDPFSRICRKLYCSTEFILVDFRCVKKIPNDAEVNPDDEDPEIVDVSANFVHLTLSFEVSYFDLLQFFLEMDVNITDVFKASLAETFNIDEERIKNLNVNITLANVTSEEETTNFLDDWEDFVAMFTVSFDLYEPCENVSYSEPSVDSIVSMLASALSVNGFDMDIANMKSRVFEIHQSMDSLQSWCGEESGGRQTEYWNSDFTLLLNEESGSYSNWIKGLFVNKTGRSYYKGQFVANILFQGYQFSNNLINVSGVVIVCDYNHTIEMKLNESCTRIKLKKEEYSILPNGSLQILNSSENANVVDDTAFEVAENDTILVCLIENKKMTDYRRGIYNLELDIIQALVSLVLLCSSVVALVIVLVTYALFSSLRNLPGCNTMNLTFSLLAMQVTFLFGQRNTVTDVWCSVVAALLHYEILCSFLWMNIMAYDLFKTFGSSSILTNIRSKRRYLPRYMLYAYGTPLIVIMMTLILDTHGEVSLAPHYGRENVCWITNKSSAVVFFAIPLALIMIINFVFYVLTIRAVRRVQLFVRLSTKENHQHGRSDVILYARMAFVTGLTWALVFAAAYVRSDEIIGQILTYFFIVLNTLQGVFIFFVFVCNRRVMKLYGGFIRKYVGDWEALKCEKHKGVISRNNQGMTRSVSTDTFTSTLSASSTNSSKLMTISEATRL